MRLSEQSFLSRFRQCITLVAIVGISPVALAEHNQPTLQLAPANVTLLGPVARHRLLPLLQAQQQVVGIASSDITWTSSDESVVTIDGTVLVPQGNGKAVVTATWNQQSARCDVTVQAFTSPHTWNFRNHVQPILARYGKFLQDIPRLNR